MNEWMLTYEEAFAAGPRVVGGKAWNLARLVRYGFPVPMGGVLIAQAYAELLETSHLRKQVTELSQLGAQDVGLESTTAALMQISSDIRGAELSRQVRASIPEFLERHKLSDRPVAVRSSAVGEDGDRASFAGIHESFLNVRGLEQVCQAILNCFASLWTPQALAYRRRMEIRDVDVACAVVICQMVASETGGPPQAAGVAFSCDPHSGRRDVISLNLSRGWGDAVVRGDVTPHAYLVDGHHPSQIVSRSEPGLSPLSDHHLAALARQLWRVHWSLGEGQNPQDVEWAFDGRKFWLLQARPVTRVPVHTFPALAGQPSFWSNANVSDSLPEPTSIMTWSLMDMVVREVLFASQQSIGYPTPDGMQVMRRFDGRYYFDMALLQWSLYDSVGVSPAEANRTTGGFQHEVRVPEGNPMSGAAGRLRAKRRLRLLRVLARLRRRLPTTIATVFEQNRRARAMNLQTLSDGDLHQELERRLASANAYLPDIQLAASYYGAWMTLLQDVLGRATGDRHQSLVTRLLAGTGGVTSAEHGYRLYELAELARKDDAARAALASNDASAWASLGSNSPFRLAFAGFLEEFGHRGVREMDFSSPRWRDAPTYLLLQIRAMLDCAEIDPRSRAAAVRERAEAELATLSWYWRPVVRWLLAKVRAGAVLRESSKSAGASNVELLQLIFREIGRRLTARGIIASEEDVFHLTLIDLEMYLLGEWSGDGAPGLIQDRRQQLEQWLKCSPPAVIVEAHSEGSGHAPPPATVTGSGASGKEEPRGGDTWVGVAAAPGQALAQARVLLSPHQGHELAVGEVLVASSTDPGWTPLFLRASAIVMETGGYLSHGAIVAREFGIPSVVNVAGVMSQVATGDWLRVDGDRGEVARVQPPNSEHAAREAEAQV